MGRPRKLDKKVAISFRASPLLADRIDQFATAMGTTTSEAVEHVLTTFFDAGMARDSILQMEARRSAAFATLDAEATVTTLLRKIDRKTLRFLRAHLEGETYRQMVGTSDTKPQQARELVRQARQVLGTHYGTLAAKPELLDHLVPRKRPNRVR